MGSGGAEGSRFQLVTEENRKDSLGKQRGTWAVWRTKWAGDQGVSVASVFRADFLRENSAPQIRTWVRYSVRWSLGWSFDRAAGRTTAHRAWKCRQDSV